MSGLSRLENSASSSASSQIGYAAGAGASVTQLTSKSTSVAINTPTGKVTTNNAALLAGASVGFTVVNTSVLATDVVCASIGAGATADTYNVAVDAIAAGSFRISLHNKSLATASDAVAVNYIVLKGASS